MIVILLSTILEAFVYYQKDLGDHDFMGQGKGYIEEELTPFYRFTTGPR